MSECAVSWNGIEDVSNTHAWLTHLSYTNSIERDQAPHFAASDLGMHCLQIFF